VLRRRCADAGETRAGAEIPHGGMLGHCWPRSRAAAEWTAWEDPVISQESTRSPGAYGDQPDDAKLAGMPGVLIHGRNDLGGGACTPWELARAWPGAELIIEEVFQYPPVGGLPEVLRQGLVAVRRRSRLTAKRASGVAGADSPGVLVITSCKRCGLVRGADGVRPAAARCRSECP
jgi:hypothetical protein